MRRGKCEEGNDSWDDESGDGLNYTVAAKKCYTFLVLFILLSVELVSS